MRKSEFSEMELRERFIEIFGVKSGLFIHKEVPVFSRSVDLVVQDIDTSSLTAIEFKIHDWKRAILQVQSVGICFDYLFICLPKPKTLAGCTKVISTCETNGVGLFFYDSNKNIFEKKIEGIKTTTIWETQKKRVISYLEANLCGG